MKLPTGKSYFIDEKKRTTSFDDVLLELWSVCRWDSASKRAVPTATGQKDIGWALDGKKRCDFIAYAIPALSKCYFLPTEILRLTLTRHLQEWQSPEAKKQGIFYPKVAPNNGYQTVNMAVPWSVLSKAMTDEMDRSFGETPCPVAVIDRRQTSSQMELAWGEPAKLNSESKMGGGTYGGGGRYCSLPVGSSPP